MVFGSDSYHRIKEMQPQAQQQRACVKCHSAHVLVLEQRQLVVCGSCEYVAPVGQESATTPRLHNATLLIYDRPVLHIFLSSFVIPSIVRSRGHVVWVDVEKLTPGCDWESGIADALTWVKEAQENGRVLLLMTPHALRRPDGYCLNEIARASSLKLNIFPVLVCDSEPPQSISMLPYFDLQSSLPRESPMAASEWDDLVATSMTSIPFQTKVLKLTGLLEAVRVCLNDISAGMASGVGFVPVMVRPCEIPLSICRIQWLDLSDCLTHQLTNNNVVNDVKYAVRLPQTAVAASVIQNQPEVRAFHLVSKEDEQTQNHRRCVLSLAYQLTTQLPDYAAFLQQGDQPLEEIVSVSCVAELVHSLLVVPLNAIAQPSTVPLVILIDGLDAFQDSNAVENCFVSSLAAAVRNLPPWVRWVLTSREDPSVMQKLQGYAVPNLFFTDLLVPQVALDKCGHQTRDDMLKYLQLALVQFVANADKNVPAATLRFIVERSEGLFLYASHIVNALSQKRLTLDKLESFPVGMGGYLRQYFEDQFTALHYESYAHRDFLGSFKSLLYVSDENELKPFHTSVFEWLEDAHAAGRFFVCAAYEHGRLLIGWVTNLLRNGHERIGLWAWNQYDTVLRATTDISNIKCAIYRL
ncbi:hypothetical protein DYB36_007438 [Aphanomyces astaci]|uniref:TIR domain-containing protein n=3 Tax=Aphanomyces astaci TaxID=112090 RepID=A0A397AFG1_APHAT|nr:hypothetical protein DYB36_007438 [Aphanomyces astaci]